MNITEVRIKLMDVQKSDKLRAFCSVTVNDEFVIRDLKIIEGTKGAFVAMPSRKLMDHCPDCGGKNHLRANYCSDCGAKLFNRRARKDDRGRAKLHADIAHPINSTCRDILQRKVLEAYQQELEQAQKEGYVPKYYDDIPDDYDEQEEVIKRHEDEELLE
ncbi:MAG: SpoVG family protein [Planctomycetota bacterium]